MASSNLNLPLSGVCDASGNGQVPVSGFTPHLFAAWNLQLAVPGNAPQVSVFQAGSLVGSAPAISGVANIGPLATMPGAPITITITGAAPGAQVAGQVQGAESDDPNDPDLAAVAGATSTSVGTTSAWDGPTLVNETGNAGQHSQDLTYPLAGGTFAVQNWASVLVGLRLSSGGPLLLTFRWYADASGARLVGQRSMMLNTDVATLVATVPNLGPYLQLVVNRVGGGTFQWNASLVASNRLVVDIFGGNFTPYLLEAYGQQQVANQTANYFLGTVYGGPVWTSIRNEGGSPGTLSLTVDPLGTDGAYHLRLGNAILNVGAGNTVNEITVLPPVPCRVQLQTGGTAGTYTWDIQVFTTTTGGS